MKRVRATLQGGTHRRTGVLARRRSLVTGIPHDRCNVPILVPFSDVSSSFDGHNEIVSLRFGRFHFRASPEAIIRSSPGKGAVGTPVVDSLRNSRSKREKNPFSLYSGFSSAGCLASLSRVRVSFSFEAARTTVLRVSSTLSRSSRIRRRVECTTRSDTRAIPSPQSIPCHSLGVTPVGSFRGPWSSVVPSSYDFAIGGRLFRGRRKRKTESPRNGRALSGLHRPDSRSTVSASS